MKIIISEHQLKKIVKKLHEGPETAECNQTSVQNDFDRAISFITTWMRNPITQKKMLSTGKVDYNQLVDIFKQYEHILSNTKLNIFNDPDSSTRAQFKSSIISSGDIFYSGNKFSIHVNCANYNSNDSYIAMLHEITHLMSKVYPINPFSDVRNMFNNTKQKDFTDDYQINIKNNLIKLGVPNEKLTMLTNWWLELLQMNSERKEYACDPDELLSNIMSIRNQFGIKPDGQITLDMIKPYVTASVKMNPMLLWILVCWGNHGFPDISGFINNINQMAMKSVSTNQNIT